MILRLAPMENRPRLELCWMSVTASPCPTSDPSPADHPKISREKGLGDVKSGVKRIMQVNGIEGVSKYVGEPMYPLDISVQADGSVVLQAPMLTKLTSVDDLRVVTEREITPQELKDLLFSWYICMNVRSNGVVLSKDNATIGVGTGQQDRITAVKLALEKAVARSHSDEIPGSVLASDGFFPFRDSIDLLAEYGVKACIQPGGSVRDKEVIAACNEHGIAMAFTDERCFRHF